MTAAFQISPATSASSPAAARLLEASSAVREHLRKIPPEWRGRAIAAIAELDRRIASETSAPGATSDRFDEWNPKAYLREYFSELNDDERHTTSFFVDEMRHAPRGPVLCFGSGPVPIHGFPAASRSDELYFADYLASNLEEIRRWAAGTADAHDWRPWARFGLSCEMGIEPTGGEVAERLRTTRDAIVGYYHADATLADPLGREHRGRFATVISAYCADSITDDKACWARYSRNIASLVQPGGMMLVAALRHSRGYRVGNHSFPSANIDENDLMDVMTRDFVPGSIEVHVRDVPDNQRQGFSAVLLARGIKQGGNQLNAHRSSRCATYATR